MCLNIHDKLSVGVLSYRLCKEIVINSAGIVGCLTTTKKGHPHQGISNIAEKGKLQKMPVFIHQRVYEKV